MEDQKKQPSNSGGGNKPSMNFYWIYGVIGVMLLAMLMLNTSEGGGKSNGRTSSKKLRTAR